MDTASSRREFLLSAAAGTALSLAPHARVPQEPLSRVPKSIPVDDLPRHFDVEPNIHNLENGYWSIMPRLVASAYASNVLQINRSNSIWARNVLPGAACRSAGNRLAREAIARQVGCQTEEIAVTRSGAEALQMLIVNYKGLKLNDAVICCDLDYSDCLAAMDWLGLHRGAQVVKFDMPEPASTGNILSAYEDVLKRTPSARLLLVTQVSNRTGLVTPVREIVAMARARGVDTIVDAAHGIACLDFKLDDLGADFVGWSVHKWTSAPLGTGAMYIRASRLSDIEAAYANHDDDDVTARVPPGTVDFAAVLTIPTAVDFHFAVSASAKERRMRSLRDRWVNGLRDLKNIEIAVPDDPARYCTITSFRLKGMATEADAQQLQHELFEKYRVLTVWRGGIAKGPVIRVTPGLYSTHADIDALIVALRREHARFT